MVTPVAAAAPQAPEPPAPPQIETSMHQAISVLGGIGYGYGFAVGYGVGARFQWVAAPKGVLKLPNGMRDEIGIEPGFDFFHASYGSGVSLGTLSAQWNFDYNEFTPVVGVVWNFWLTREIAVYPKIDLGYRIAEWSVSETVSGASGGPMQVQAHADVSPVYFQGAAGVAWRFSDALSLRAEVGWNTLRAGIAAHLL